MSMSGMDGRTDEGESLARPARSGGGTLDSEH